MAATVSLPGQFALIAALSAADALATDLLVTTGLAAEANPVMAPFVAAGLGATLAAKAASLAAAAAGFHVLHRRGRTRLAHSLARALIWAYAGVAVLHAYILTAAPR